MHLIQQLYLKIKSNKIYLIILLIFCFSVFFWIINKVFFKQYLLQINALPSGSTILVDNKHTATTSFSKKVNEGKHKIIVSKPNYQTVEKEINVFTNTILEISLESLTKPIKSINFLNTEIKNRTFLSNLNLQSDGLLIAYDVENSQLISINKGKINTLYQGSLVYYSYVKPLITFIDKKNVNEIQILDINSGNVIQKFSVNNIAPVLFSYLDPNNNTIFLLGKFDYKKKESNLYVTKTTNFQPKIITQINATEIELVKNSLLLLFDKVNGLDESLVRLFDIDKNKEVFKSNGNNYSFSPSKKYLAIQKSNLLTIINLTDFSQKTQTTNFLEQITWLNDEILLIINTEPSNVQFFGLNQSDFKRYPISITNKPTTLSINQLIGVLNNTLYFLDKNGFLNEIFLSYQ